MKSDALVHQTVDMFFKTYLADEKIDDKARERVKLQDFLLWGHRNMDELAIDRQQQLTNMIVGDITYEQAEEALNYVYELFSNPFMGMHLTHIWPSFTLAKRPDPSPMVAGLRVSIAIEYMDGRVTPLGASIPYTGAPLNDASVASLLGSAFKSVVVTVSDIGLTALYAKSLVPDGGYQTSLQEMKENILQQSKLSEKQRDELRAQSGK